MGYCRKLLIAAALWFGSAAAMAATYVYSGPNYLVAAGAFTTSMRISGSFTTAAPLPANMALTAIGPRGAGLVTAWHFADGVTAYSESDSTELYGNPLNFAVATDAAGNISYFSIALMKPTPPNTVGQIMAGVASITSSYYGAVAGAACSAVVDDICTSFPATGTIGDAQGTQSGRFILQVASSPIPTLPPSSLAALAALILFAGIASVRRRKG